MDANICETSTSVSDMELAPSTWGQLGLDAYEYLRIGMMTEFEEFRLSKGSWKLD